MKRVLLFIGLLFCVGSMQAHYVLTDIELQEDFALQPYTLPL